MRSLRCNENDVVNRPGSVQDTRDGPDSEPLQEKALEAPESPDGIGEDVLRPKTVLRREFISPDAGGPA